MDLELISFPTCPFVHRARIALHEKDVAHRLRLIDLADRPDWLRALSPRGKVPVLLADGVPLFESSAILEFLEDVLPEPPLRSADPVERARERAWTQLASEDVFLPQLRWLLARERTAHDEALGALHAALGRLDAALEGRRWLSGDGARFGFADVAMAPAFARVEVLHRRGLFAWPEGLERVRAWSGRLARRPSVEATLPADWAERMAAHAARHGGGLVLPLAPAGASAPN